YMRPAARSRASAISSSSCSSAKTSSTRPLDTFAWKPVIVCSESRTRAASAGSTGVERTRGFCFAPAHFARCSATRTERPFCTISRASRRRPSWSGTARTALAELPTLDHAEHVLGQLEEAYAIGDGRLRTADPLGHLALREPELVDEHGVRPRLLHR